MNSIRHWQPVYERIIKIDLSLYGRQIIIFGIDKSKAKNRKLTNRGISVRSNWKYETQSRCRRKGRTDRRDNDKTVGRFGKDTLYVNAELVTEICQINDLRITNCFDRCKNIHKCT